MSQHHYFTLHENKKIHILLGWDKPLQGFYLVIEREDDNDESFWSNLYIKESHPKRIDPFLLVLESYGIGLPDHIVQEVINDGIGNLGNKEVIHSYKNGNYERIEEDILNENVPYLYDKYN